MILLPLSQDVPSLIPENCVRVRAILPPDFLSTPSTNQEDLSTGRPNSFCHPSFHFDFWIFWDSGHSLLVAYSSLRSNTEPENELEAALFPEAVCTYLLNESCVSSGTTRGTNCPSCRQ